MNFELTEERRMLQDTLRKCLAKTTDKPWQELAELGVIGALFKEEHGGFGGTGFDLAVVFEELGRAKQIIPLIDTALVPGRLIVACGGSVDALIKGTEKLAFAHTELAARYDLNWVETSADGDQLSGEKTLVAGAEEADAIIVSARHKGTAESTAGIGLWRVATDGPGLTPHSYDLAQGGRASEVTLDNTPGTPLMLDAYGAITDAMSAGLVAQSAETLGAMETAVDITRDYLGTRKQFGRTIGSFQALSHRLVDRALGSRITRARQGAICNQKHTGSFGSSGSRRFHPATWRYRYDRRIRTGSLLQAHCYGRSSLRRYRSSSGAVH